MPHAASENEILMQLRRTNKTRTEVSFDEPLNVDWDGNELKLSDVMGTEEDIIYQKIEEDIDRTLLSLAMSKLERTGAGHRGAAFWTGGSGGKNAEGGGGSFGHFSVIYLQAGKKDPAPSVKRISKAGIAFNPAFSYELGDFG